MPGTVSVKSSRKPRKNIPVKKDESSAAEISDNAARAENSGDGENKEIENFDLENIKAENLQDKKTRVKKKVRVRQK